MVKGLWVTEKSGHREGNLASEQINVTCDSEGSGPFCVNRQIT